MAGGQPGNKNIMSFSESIKELKISCNTVESEIGNLGKEKLFSPNSYNRISLPILKLLTDLMDDISSYSDGISPDKNLGVIFSTNLQQTISFHYFQEYERFFSINNYRAKDKNKFSSGLNYDFKSITSKFIKNTLFNLSKINKSNKKVGYLGVTTVNWVTLWKELKKNNINLSKIDTPNDVFIPHFNFQISLIKELVLEIHKVFCELINTKTSNIKMFDLTNHFKKHPYIKKFSRNNEKEHFDLIISGSVGSPLYRSIILEYQKNNTPYSLMHHGGSYLMYDEPFYNFYEGVFADTKLVYGDVIKQKKISALGPTKNIWGRDINFISRIDPIVNVLSKNNSIEIQKLKSLKNKKVLYFATEFSYIRYGPHRDVHPIIYLAWQEKLIEWLRNQTGIEPFIKLHPKRVTKQYDPVSNNIVTNSKIDNFFEADLFVVDYPTTSLTYTSSTDKPVIFFDLGLRRINQNIMNLIKKRCHYVAADINNPEEGLEAMENEFSKTCYDEYTSTVASDGSKLSEIELVSNSIIDIVK